MYRTYIMISGLLCFGIVSNNKYLCSLHGLIRGENMELGRDSDTGGQVLFHHKCLFFDVFVIVSFEIFITYISNSIYETILLRFLM